MVGRLVGTLRLVLFAAVTAALVATSAPEDETEYSDRGWATLTSEGELSLTGASPSRSQAFRVVAKKPRFSSLRLVLTGNIEHAGQNTNGDAGALADFVEVQLTSNLTTPTWQGPDEETPKQTVLTQFELRRSGELAGDCADGCSADVVAHFARLDAGVFGADAVVRWTLTVKVLIESGSADAGLEGWSLEAIDGATSEIGSAKDAEQ